MSTVNFSIAFADVDGFPAGAAVAGLTLSITDPDGIVTPHALAATATTASVVLTTVGGYTASLQAVDASNAPLGSAVNATFSISAPATVSLSLPAALSATVA